MMSIDVESLFTNVPVEETVKIVLENVYDYSETGPLNLLQGMLLTCTKETPFVTPQTRCIYRKMAVQWDHALYQPC